MYRPFALLALAAVSLTAAAASAATPRVFVANGLVVTVPQGWHATDTVFSTCTDPSQVLVLASGRHPVRSGLLLVLEDTVNSPRSFKRRRSFRLPERATAFEGCCNQPTAPGYEFAFRDRGRDFEAFVWSRDHDVAEAAVAALNTLRVRPSS